jgi:hypothetical protein
MPKPKYLIPDGTTAKVKLRILPGGYNDASQGWTEGFASLARSGSIYLNVEYSVVEGIHAGKKFSSIIGLKSPKGPWWRKKGRNLILAILNAKSGFPANDYSENALQARRLDSLKMLNNIQFLARIKAIKDKNDYMVNEIDKVIEPNSLDHPDEPPRLRQRELTSNLNKAGDGPLWMQD